MRKSAVTAYKMFKANVGKPITPAELEAKMDVGPYAGREVWILKTRLGMKIEAQKDGRTVVSYTLTELPEKEPQAITDHFNKGRAKKAKTKPAPAKAKTAPAKPKKTTKAKTKKVEPVEEVTINLDTAEVGGGEFSVDGDFDAVDEGDLPEFLQPEVLE